jgi:hypothetical protein
MVVPALTTARQHMAMFLGTRALLYRYPAAGA